jgi:hypothetical protein
MENLDPYDYANIFSTFEDTDGYVFFNLMNTLNIDGEIDPQFYKWDMAHSFASVYELSNKHYKTPKLWWIILLANDIKNPFDIQPGQRVKILEKVAVAEIINQINKP